MGQRRRSGHKGRQHSRKGHVNVNGGVSKIGEEPGHGVAWSAGHPTASANTIPTPIEI
jgi:hypothetical protein